MDNRLFYKNLPREMNCLLTLMTVKQKEKTLLFSSRPNLLAGFKNSSQSLPRWMCCVTAWEKARQCNCLSPLANKPSVVNGVALLVQMHFVFYNRNRRYHLVPRTRHTDTIMCKRKQVRKNFKATAAHTTSYPVCILALSAAALSKSRGHTDTYIWACTSCRVQNESDLPPV